MAAGLDLIPAGSVAAVVLPLLPATSVSSAAPGAPALLLASGALSRGSRRRERAGAPWARPPWGAASASARRAARSLSVHWSAPVHVHYLCHCAVLDSAGSRCSLDVPGCRWSRSPPASKVSSLVLPKRRPGPVRPSSGRIVLRSSAVLASLASGPRASSSSSACSRPRSCRLVASACVVRVRFGGWPPRTGCGWTRPPAESLLVAASSPASSNSGGFVLDLEQLRLLQDVLGCR